MLLQPGAYCCYLESAEHVTQQNVSDQLSMDKIHDHSPKGMILMVVMLIHPKV